jgi:hypothetical protein
MPDRSECIHKISSDITWLQFAQIYLAFAMGFNSSTVWLGILALNNACFLIGAITHEN